MMPICGLKVVFNNISLIKKCLQFELWVEWVFKDIGQQLFSFLSFTPYQKHLQQRVGPQFIVGTLRTGYGVQPPTLNEYFHD